MPRISLRRPLMPSFSLRASALLLILAGVVISAPRAAADPEPEVRLFLDIVPGPQDSDPMIMSWQGAAWFIARDGDGSAQLWRSDGTIAGTEMLLDPSALCGVPTAFWSMHAGDSVLYLRGEGCAGNQQLYVTTDEPEWGITSFPLTTAGGFVSNIATRGDDAFFTYGPAQFFDELWFSDGSPESAGGTYLVKDLWPGPGRADVSEMTVYGDHAYFIARDVGPRMMYRSDGTAAGTEVFLDIEPNSRGIVHSFTVVNDLMWFRADVDSQGAGLWVTDGTVAGTRVVADPSIGGEWPTDFTSFEGSVVYGANHPTLGNELFLTDGTESGTRLLVDVRPGPTGSRPFQLLPTGSLLYFSGRSADGEELYVYDDVTGEATQLTDWIEVYGPNLLGVVEGDLLFSATDDFDVDGEELWIVEEGATWLVLDINPGPANGYPGPPVETENGFLFSAVDDAHGRELWLYDPTSFVEAELDIRPGSTTNPVNLRSRGVLQVAILSTHDFDATSVIPSTVRVGPTGAEVVTGSARTKDVNRDRNPDLLLKFRIAAIGIGPGDTELCLTAETSDGRQVEGCDRVTVKGKPKQR